MKVIIIGAVAGGASTATRLRRLNDEAEIKIFEKGPYPSYSNCAIPNFLSRDVKSYENLLLNSPESFKTRFNIDVEVNSEVTKVFPEEKKIEIKSEGKTYTEDYDKLVVATGAEAIVPSFIKGVDLPHVFTVKTVPDVVKLDKFLRENEKKKVTVIGGGFIGLEVMENLKRAGFEVSIIEATNQVMAPVDYEIATIIHKEIHDNGVDLYLEDPVSEITEKEVILKSGNKIETDAVVLAIGVRPTSKILEVAGAKVDDRGYLEISDTFETSLKDVYAVGDVVKKEDFMLGGLTNLELAGPAQKQARALADHLAGRKSKPVSVIGSSAVRVFDLNIACTGLNEKKLKDSNIEYKTSYVIPVDKVGIIGGANPIFMKLIFDEEGKVLGAQAAGRGTVDKRIDVVAAYIRMNGKLEDLYEYEHAYAPYFAPPKDAVHLAAMVGQNILNGDVRCVTMKDLRSLYEEGAYIVDVREKNEFENGHIKGAHNIPLTEIRNRISEVPKDVPVYLHCRSSQRSYYAYTFLRENGYKNIYNIQGSYLWFSLYEYFDDLRLKREPIFTKYNFK